MSLKIHFPSRNLKLNNWHSRFNKNMYVKKTSDQFSFYSLLWPLEINGCVFFMIFGIPLYKTHLGWFWSFWKLPLNPSPNYSSKSFFVLLDIFGCQLNQLETIWGPVGWYPLVLSFLTKQPFGMGSWQPLATFGNAWHPFETLVLIKIKP